VFRIDFPQIFEVAGEARPAGSLLP
jgi:hypothetical protein